MRSRQDGGLRAAVEISCRERTQAACWLTLLSAIRLSFSSVAFSCSSTWWRTEAQDIAGEVDDPQVLDAALLAAAQAVEHYEITRYGTLIAWAKQLGRNDCASVLQQNLDEEKATDAKLTAMAESKVNRKAA